MAHRLNQLRTSTLTTHDQFTSLSSTVTSSPRTPGKKLTKGDPIVTGIRLRPFLERESAIDDTPAVQIFENNVICTQNSRPQIFKFTHCFDASAKNKNVYDGIIRSAVLASLQGYNTTVLAYGQTASGKSHSIFGSSCEEGILSLSIHDLITMNGNNHLKFELSFLEIYNEKVTDLLAIPTTSNEHSNQKSSTKSSTTLSFSKQARTHIFNKLVPNSNTTNTSTRTLEIREHPSLGPYVPDLKYIQVKSKEDFQNVLNLGNQQRSVASTNANQRSSRSHAIFTVKISRIDIPQSTNMRLSFGLNTAHSLSNIGKHSTLSSSSKKSAKQQAQDELDAQAVRLNFVDLAGSEKSQQYNGTQGKNDRFAESVHINQSLSTLRNVIDALSRQQSHIPYRDSNLTYLLKNSLGGDAKTFMLATISPSSTVIDETINTLRYAGLASTITNVPRIKTPHLRHEIDELREENARLKQELFLVKSKSMPSIHPTINKITLPRIDECIQTSFQLEPSISHEELNNDEKLDTVDEEILAQIENQCRRPKRKRLSEQPLHEIAKVRKIDDTMLHRRLGTILSYVTDDFSIINDNGILVISNELDINVKKDSSSWMNALEKFDRNIDINSMTKKEIKRMTSKHELTRDPSDTSSTSFHFGQLVWAKLASAPFWPAVIFTEENQDWIRHKGKSTYVHVFFFGETAERSWIQTTRVLPFIGPEKFSRQRRKWRRKMKSKSQEEQRLTLKDKSNLNIAIKQTVKLSKLSLRKRITILKNEWWYWDDINQPELISEVPTKETNIEEDKSILIKDQENDTEEILQLFSTNPDELDDIICLSDVSTENNETQSSLKHTSSVCFHPLTSYEEETIIREMISSFDNSFLACRCRAEKEYLLCIQKNFPSTSIISEHWFYLFLFRHCERLARTFPKWINDMKLLLEQSPLLSPMHQSQIQSLIILFKQYCNNHQQQ
ncbi:unnamed protein product [Rotaria sp. Silwood1]|nr:unnamed protein product [Rotaria sp. Silwood1]